MLCGFAPVPGLFPIEDHLTMNQSIAAGLTGLVAGAFAGTVILLVGLPAGTADVGPRTLTTAAQADGGELTDVVARIDREQAELRDELDLHRTSIDQRFDELLGAIDRRSVAVAPASDDASASSSDLASSLDPAALPAPTDPGFETAVASALENIEARERAEREAEREQRELDRIEERIAGMREALGLDQFQETEVRTLLIDSMHEMNEVRVQMRSGELERGEIRATFGALRTSVEEGFKGILTPAQYTQLEESGADFGGFGGGRRGGFGGGPGGGPGGAPGGGPF